MAGRFIQNMPRRVVRAAGIAASPVRFLDRESISGSPCLKPYIEISSYVAPLGAGLLPLSASARGGCAALCLARHQTEIVLLNTRVDYLSEPSGGLRLPYDHDSKVSSGSRRRRPAAAGWEFAGWMRTLALTLEAEPPPAVGTAWLTAPATPATVPNTAAASKAWAACHRPGQRESKAPTLCCKLRVRSPLK